MSQIIKMSEEDLWLVCLYNHAYVVYITRPIDFFKSILYTLSDSIFLKIRPFITIRHDRIELRNLSSICLVFILIVSKVLWCHIKCINEVQENITQVLLIRRLILPGSNHYVECLMGVASFSRNL